VTTRALIVTVLAVLAFPAGAAAAPTVDLNAGPNPAHRNEKVSAKIRVSNAVGAVSIQWAVDGKVMTKFEGSPELTGSFAVLGSHTIAVAVGDSTTGKSPVVASQDILVQNGAPVAAIAQDPAAPVTGEPITISSASTDPDGDPLLCVWDLNGDGTFETPGCSVTRTIAKAGAFNVALKVTDGTATDTVTRTVTVANRPPVARIAAVTDALTGDEISLDGRGSGDPDGTIVSGAWDLDGDGEFDDAAGPIATVAFDAAGDHTVALQVVDDNGATSVATAVIRVGQGAVSATAAATAAADAPAPPAKVGATLRYAFTRTRTTTMFTSLLVRNLPVGAKVKARCTGGGCARRTFTAIAKTDTVSLRTLIRRKLKVGAVIRVEVSKPGMTTRTIVVTVRKGKDPKLAGK
jgi:PKD repeat protein